MLEDRGLTDKARKVAPELIFDFLVADKSFILINSTIVINPFERSGDMPNKMKQFLIVKLIYACFNMLIVNFAELAVQFFEDVREVDGNVVGFHVLQISDI